MKMSHEELMASQRRLTEEMGIAWRDCSTVIAISPEHPQHHPMPAWINPYDTRIIEDEETLKRWRRQGKKPTTMYQQRINTLALRIIGKTWDDLKTPEDWAAFRAAKAPATGQLRDDLCVFLTGFTDSQGNSWCGHCYSRCQFVDIGSQLGYPALWVSSTDAGYEAWLKTARYGGIVTVEDGYRLALKIKAERQAVQA